jgi:HD-GYP domain-containing protein (c-di-GMP phosphodiesterase class II)
MIGEDRKGRLVHIPVARLHVPAPPARGEASPEEIARLAASIRSHGLLHPILVRPAGRGYEIVCGLRRFLACRALGMGEVPAVVRRLDDREAAEIFLAENARREGLGAGDRERLLRRLRALFPGRSWEELEAWLGPMGVEVPVKAPGEPPPPRPVEEPASPTAVDLLPSVALPDWIDQIPQTAAGELINAAETAPTVPAPPVIPAPAPGPAVVVPTGEELKGTRRRERTHVRRQRLLPRLRLLLKKLKRSGALDASLLGRIVREIFDMADRLPLLDFLDLRYREKPRRYLPRHCLNVAKLGLFLARQLGLSAEDVEQVVVCGLLHDAGMLRIRGGAFTKRGPLSQKQWRRVKEHPAEGALLLTREAALRDVVMRVALEHHERPDGTGYPRGKKKEEIHPYARLVKVVDTYEALVSPRVYRLPLLPFHAMQIVMDEGAKGLLDWDIVHAFVKAVSVYPLGTYVKLETGEVARVVRSRPEAPERPVLQVLADANRKVLKDPIVLDLAVAEPPPKIEPIPPPV